MKVDGKEYYSVSQLGAWGECHKMWYLKKILNYVEPGETSPYLIRGKLVHKVLEKVENFKQVVELAQKHKDFNLIPDSMKADTINMMKMFEHDNKLPSEPIKTEMEIINHDLSMVAYLDVVGKDYIVDYKTSKFWRQVPDHYWWQLKIYALLYYLETGKFIRHLGVYYLKYGRIEWLTIEESDLPKIRKVVEDAIADIEDHLARNDFECTYNGTYTCKCGILVPKT